MGSLADHIRAALASPNGSISDKMIAFFAALENPADGDVLTYDSGSGLWSPEAVPPPGAHAHADGDLPASIARDTEVKETPTFSKGGVLVVGVGTFRWYAPRALTIVSVRASVGTAPTGASLIVDVNKNEVTIFTTQSNRPTIAVSTNTDLADAIDVTALAAGDYLTVDIDQIGSTVAGSDLTVQVEVRL